MTETLQSLSTQSFNDWECLLVDDGSTDSTLEIGQAFSQKDLRFRVFSRSFDLPKGANVCRNLGASFARSNLIMFLDADDLLSSNGLEYRLSKIKVDSDLTVFRTAVFDNNPHICEPFNSYPLNGLSKESLLNLFLNYRIPWHTSSPVWKKTFFESIGGFDADLLRFQDVDIHIRALANPDAVVTVIGDLNYTSFYRKSAYHAQIDLEKRAFIFDQGLIFLEKIKENLGCFYLGKSFGILLYLLFRFEEVIDRNKLLSLRTLYFTGCQIPNVPSAVSLMFLLEESLISKPNRLRKLISFGIYRIHRKLAPL